MSETASTTSLSRGDTEPRYQAHTLRGGCRSLAQWNRCIQSSLGLVLLADATSFTAATIRPTLRRDCRNFDAGLKAYSRVERKRNGSPRFQEISVVTALGSVIGAPQLS